MDIYTAPREIGARYVRMWDQVAVFQAGVVTATDHPDGVASQVRSVESAHRGDVGWLDVVQPPSLVAGEVGVFAVTLAERYADGRHGPLLEIRPTEGQQLVIRERITVGREVTGRGARAPRADPATVDYLDTADAAHDMLPPLVERCGAWVDYGPCALRVGHPAAQRCATRNNVLAQLATVEGQPASPVGITAAAYVIPQPRCGDEQPATAGGKSSTQP